MDTVSLNNVDWAGMALKFVLAIVIIVVTLVVASVVRNVVKRLTGRVEALQRAGGDGASLGDSLGAVAALMVWLFGLIALLQLFNLSNVLAPIEALLGQVLSYVPNVIGAVFVFIVGALIAKIVREIVQTALSAIDLRGLMNRGHAAADRAAGVALKPGLGSATALPTEPIAQSTDVRGGSASAGGTGTGDSAQLAKTVATVVYALIMIVVAISALQILQIAVISRPAELMLAQIFNAVPVILAAAVIVGLGVWIARFARDLLEQILVGVGTDKALAELNIAPEGRSASSIIAWVAQVAIVLFSAVMAASVLGFPQVTELLQRVLELGGRVLFGGAVIAIGFFVARLLAEMASGAAATIVRYATLVLFGAMGLKSMGIADSIIELGFGALVIGGAAAAALAFGLGGRDAAARQLASLQSGSAGAGSAGAGSGAGSAPKPAHTDAIHEAGDRSTREAD